MSALARLLAVLAALLRRPGAVTGAPHPAGDGDAATDPRERYLPRRPRAERAVATLLASSGVLGLAFAVVYVLGADTQVLGATGGLALAALAAALLLASFRVVVQETAVEAREPFGDPEGEDAVAAGLAEVTEGVSRRRLIAAAAGAAGAGLGAAAIATGASLGPRVGGELVPSPWRAGRRLVDADDRPVVAADLSTKSFVTAFPQGADKRELGSAVVLVRVDVAELRLPPERRGWAPGGLLAFSKVCTHAGCAVALYRVPKSESTSSPPGLVCPCHYSTFDPRRGAAVAFGPAGRPLPQLPLRVAADGTVEAAGPMSGPIGPAWWGVS